MPYRTSDEPPQFPPGFVEALKAAFVVDASKPDRVALQVKGRFGEGPWENPYTFLLWFLTMTAGFLGVVNEVSVAHSRCITVVTVCCAIAFFAYKRWGFGTKWLVMYAGMSGLTVRLGGLSFTRPPSAPYVFTSWRETGVLIDDLRYVLRRRCLRAPGAIARACAVLGARIASSIGPGTAQPPSDAAPMAVMTPEQGRALARTFECFSRSESETVIPGERRSFTLLNGSIGLLLIPIGLAAGVQLPLTFMAAWSALPVWLLLLVVIFAFGRRRFARRQRTLLVFRRDSDDVCVRRNGHETPYRSWRWKTDTDDDDAYLSIIIDGRTYPMAHAVDTKDATIATRVVRRWSTETLAQA